MVIPPHVLANAKGLAIMAVLKAGFIGSARAGSGVVVARLADGTWSAPSAIGTVGGGVGGQIGFELTDFVFILNNANAVKTFAQAGSVTLGANVSIAAGPVGRNAEAAGAASLKSVSEVFAYSRTKGLFAGVSLEGSVILERRDTNEKYYNIPHIKAIQLLQGAVPVPAAADPLMRVLNSRTFSGLAGPNTMYNDNSVYDEYSASIYHDPSRNQRSGADRPQRSSTWADGIYDREPSYSSRADPSETFDSINRRDRAQSTSNTNDYVYSDKPKPNRPTAPKPAFTPRKQTSPLAPGQAIAKFTFDSEQEGDLGFKKGEIITIVKRTETETDWWTGRIGARQGIFPR